MIRLGLKQLALATVLAYIECMKLYYKNFNVLGEPLQPSQLFVGKAMSLLLEWSALMFITRKGYLQILDYAEKSCQGQTIYLNCPNHQ